MSLLDNGVFDLHGLRVRYARRSTKPMSSESDERPVRGPKARGYSSIGSGNSCRSSGTLQSQWGSLFDCQGDGNCDDREPDRGASTLPYRKAGASSFRVRPSLRTFESDPNGVRPTTLSRSVDRFLPVRRSSLMPSIHSFRTNKDPKALSTDELLHRHPEVSPDAFNPRSRRASSPLPVARRPQARRVWGNRSANRGGASVLSFQRDSPGPDGSRQVSVGTVWAVGGIAPVTSGVPNGRGRLLGSGTNARLYTTPFSAGDARSKTDIEKERYENRLADALNLDRVSRVFEFRDPSTAPPKKTPEFDFKTTWNGTEWVLSGPERKAKPLPEFRELPTAPFKVLDAPHLRDDFYCSILAYSPTCHTLAVGLGGLLYGWSEMNGVKLLHGGGGNGSWLTALAFSSPQGLKSILAFGRSDGKVNLMSLYDSLLPRFEVQQPHPIACITWRPSITVRATRNPNSPKGVLVQTEDLVVGDENGHVYYYSVEWPEVWELSRDGWSGSMTLLARVSVHTQQICGLSFSRDGSMFATGGNDNLCCLFETHKVLKDTERISAAEEVTATGANGASRTELGTGSGNTPIKEIIKGAERHRWTHGAAVKAIAFCPWRNGLMATGGGSNDKCIHFYHTLSGACLATISVAAQVTSLIWSTTRREICATFGYAQPEHPYRIAVFSWPDCQQVAAIAWPGEHRALYAIPYPGGPNESHTSKEGGAGLSRTAKEGCIVVASSDESVKFHEVWTSSPKATIGGPGSLGGSDILEGLEGIDKEGEIIR